MSNNISPLPKISIISPSYNQSFFLEQTILSILNQGYVNLEYIIIDGGSSDSSVSILEKYNDRLAYWISEEDNGQYHAINKGMRHSTGEILAWLNSDDMYLPWTLQCIGEIFAKYPEIKWLTSSYPMSCNQVGLPVFCRSVNGGFSREGFLRGENFSGGGGKIKGLFSKNLPFGDGNFGNKQVED